MRSADLLRLTATYGLMSLFAIGCADEQPSEDPIAPAPPPPELSQEEKVEEAMMEWANGDREKLATLNLAEFRAAPNNIDRYIYDQCSADRKLALWQEKLDQEMADSSWSEAQQAHIADLRSLLALDHFKKSWSELPQVYADWTTGAEGDFDASSVQSITGSLQHSSHPNTVLVEKPEPDGVMIQVCTCTSGIWDTHCSKTCHVPSACGTTSSGCGFLSQGSCDGLCY